MQMENGNNPANRKVKVTGLPHPLILFPSPNVCSLFLPCLFFPLSWIISPFLSTIETFKLLLLILHMQLTTLRKEKLPEDAPAAVPLAPVLHLPEC